VQSKVYSPILYFKFLTPRPVAYFVKNQYLYISKNLYVKEVKPRKLSHNVEYRVLLPSITASAYYLKTEERINIQNIFYNVQILYSAQESFRFIEWIE